MDRCAYRGALHARAHGEIDVYSCLRRSACTLEPTDLTQLDGAALPSCRTCSLRTSPDRLVSAICLAYDLPRRQTVLEEAIESFLRQTYPFKELIVVNDTPGLTIECQAPGVRVVDIAPCQTLGEKYNAGIEAAAGDLICCWDDDDICLPWRMALSVELLGAADYYNPKAYWFDGGHGLIHEVRTGYAHNASLYRRSAWDRVGRYPHLADNSQDAWMDHALQSQVPIVLGTGRIELTSYLYRWATGLHHGSTGPARPRPLGQGRFVLRPGWRQDYTRLTLAARPAGVPCWLTNRDTMTVRTLVDQLILCEDVGPITIVDCDSTYPPLLEWYDTVCPVRVIRAENLGSHAAWSYLDTSSPYLVSDADLDLARVPRDFVRQLQRGLDRYPDAIKCGLSLSLEALPDASPVKSQVIAHESSFWSVARDPEFYDAAVDTTMALYRAASGWGGYAPALRAAPPYTARHVPWDLVPGQVPPDWEHYFQRLDPLGLGWSPVLGRLLRRPCPEPLEALYLRACETHSDIHQHCPALRRLAGQSGVVVELGMRHGVSTTALLAGQPDTLVTTDLHRNPVVDQLTAVRGRTEFSFVQGDSRSVAPRVCDLLFIDTRHTQMQLAAELKLHAPHCRHWIALHDTETFGEIGEDGEPGLRPAIREFLAQNPQWFVLSHDRENHGLTVLSCEASEHPGRLFDGFQPRRRPRLTIGMACYRDWPGVWATIQSLRVNHAECLEDIEIVVVDNDPEGKPHEPSEFNHSSKCRGLCERIGARYDHFTAVSGTAAAKGRIFELASAPFVLVIDCHVLLPSGVVRRLMDWFAAHPQSRDLWQGPCLGDGGLEDIVGTHFEPRWGSLMYGQWGIDPRAHRSDEPFEIEMQGCGLFACHRAAWPGFHPLLRGFGPEEFHLHQRIRRNGGRCFCLPWLKWCHRFGNPDGARPPGLHPEERLRGHLITLLDTGAPPLDQLRHHFVEEARALSAEQFERVLARTRSEFNML